MTSGNIARLSQPSGSRPVPACMSIASQEKGVAVTVQGIPRLMHLPCYMASSGPVCLYKITPTLLIAQHPVTANRCILALFFPE